MEKLSKLIWVMHTIATAAGIAVIAGCNNGGSGGQKTTTSGYMNGPGVPVPTINVSASSNTNANNEPADDPLLLADKPIDPGCSLDERKLWVDNSMRDFYLFYDQVPDVNLDDYDSEASLLADLRVQPKDKFSATRDLERSVRWFEQGKLFGFGYRWERDEQGVARIARVIKDSPFGRAGVSRGDIIVSINGVGWEDISDSQFDEMVSKPSTWAFTDAINGTQFEAVLEKSEYFNNTVLHYQTITNAEYDGTIGYLAFDRFLDTSAEELDIVMKFFKQQNITDLVLDLRYNNGGLGEIARKLASQLAGPETDGKLFLEYRYNDKYAWKNYDTFLENEVENLGLDRLAVLTTQSTNSPPEMVINGLSPYIPVVRFGGTTRGNSYISFFKNRCDKRLFAIEAEAFNAKNVSVAGGLAANCAATDDLTRDFGLNGETGQVEGMLASALDFLVYGICNDPTTSGMQRNATGTGLELQENLPVGSINVR